MSTCTLGWQYEETGSGVERSWDVLGDTKTEVLTPPAGCVQALQPHVRIWDSVSLSTLQVIGLGTFERGVGSLAFSKAVSMSQVHHGSRVFSPLTLASSTCGPQDSGQHLSVVDDCNDHMLTVWDWHKKSKIAEIKVKLPSRLHCSAPIGLWLTRSVPFRPPMRWSWLWSSIPLTQTPS